jgi:hypothetical protein
MRRYTTSEVMRVFEALGFTPDDSYSMTMGWTNEVMYYCVSYL